MNFQELSKLKRVEFLTKIGHINEFKSFILQKENQEKYPNLVSAIQAFLDDYGSKKDTQTIFDKKSSYLFELIWDEIQNYNLN